MNGDSSAPCSAAGFGISASCADSHRKAQASPALLALRGPIGPTPSLFSSAKTPFHPFVDACPPPFPCGEQRRCGHSRGRGGNTGHSRASGAKADRWSLPPSQRDRSPARDSVLSIFALPGRAKTCFSCRPQRRDSPIWLPILLFPNRRTAQKTRSARLTPPAPQKRGPFPMGRALSFFVFSLYSSSNWPV